MKIKAELSHLVSIIVGKVFFVPLPFLLVVLSVWNKWMKMTSQMFKSQYYQTLSSFSHFFDVKFESLLHKEKVHLL